MTERSAPDDQTGTARGGSGPGEGPVDAAEASTLPRRRFLGAGAATALGITVSALPVAATASTNILVPSSGTAFDASTDGSTSTPSGTTAATGVSYRVFTTNGNFVVDGSGYLNADVVLIGGGGGGGRAWAGGGAGGAVSLHRNQQLEPGTYPVVIGTGGAGATGLESAGAVGGATSFGAVGVGLTLSASGGGGGTSGEDAFGGAGGVSPAGTGSGSSSFQGGGGGGYGYGGGGAGAGGAGQDFTVVPGVVLETRDSGGAGGAGFTVSAFFASPWVAAGGGGGGGDPGASVGGAGTDGGGTGGAGAPGSGADGFGAGGGGGGGTYDTFATDYPGGPGSGGVVIVRYLLTT